MGVRERGQGKNKKPKKINYGEKQFPLSEEAVFNETPYFFTVELESDGETIEVPFFVEQFNTQEYLELFNRINLLKVIMLKAEKEIIKENRELFILATLPAYIGKLCKMVKPEQLVNKHILKVVNEEKINFLKRYWIYRRFLKNKVQNTSFKELKETAETYIENIKTDILKLLPYNHIIDIANQILYYNDNPQKKSLCLP